MPLPVDAFRPLLARGDFADVYLEESRFLTLRREQGRLEEASSGLHSGAGLRYWNGPRTLYGHVDGLFLSDGGAPDALSATARRLGRGLKTRRPAPLRPREAATPPLPPAVSPSDKARLLERAESAARIDPSVRQVTVLYAERLKRIGYVNSAGEAYEESRAYVFLSVQVTAERDGLRQTGYEVLGGTAGPELFDLQKPEQAAALAARRAVAKLSAPPAPLGERPVVIAAEAGGTLIHEAIGHALEADAIQEGISPHFAGKVGRAVANEKVSVLDDPTLAGRRGSFRFDDEGVPASRTVLVENGVLRTYLYDRRSAARDRLPSNGHGRRQSYAHKPIPRMGNTFIAPGVDDPAEIVRSLDRGLLVTRMGGGQVNTTTGDFVFEVGEGFWVEGGRVKHMVRGATLLGNGAEVLRSIDRVGSDLGWSLGTCGKEGQGVPVADAVPTLRVPKLVIGGGQE